METELIISFFGASVLLTLMPGPDNIFVLTESLTKGPRNGIVISLGLVSGILVHTCAAATGLSIIIQKSAVVFSVIKYLGAGYLLYLAVQAYRDKTTFTGTEQDEATTHKSFAQLIRTGFLMNVLNPKVSLFFIAFLPQFISKKGMNITYQMILLGLMFMVQAIVIFSIISLTAGRLAKQMNNMTFWRVTKAGKVVVLVGLGITLAFSGK
jgi:threonine/homoserine/homoserine lactone efflux protein